MCICSDRQAIDDKESTRQRDAQEQMRTEQGNLKDLISVVKDMVHVQVNSRFICN